MSKHERRIERTAPEAITPAPITATPEPPVTEAITKKPDVPPFVLGMARAVKIRWGVPEWLTIHAAYTGSKFGTVAHPTGSMCGIKAEGTEPADQEGMAWFGTPMHGFDRFGWICSGLALDYANPVECLAKLKARCPKINTISHTLFMEA